MGVSTTLSKTMMSQASSEISWFSWLILCVAFLSALNLIQTGYHTITQVLVIDINSIVMTFLYSIFVYLQLFTPIESNLH